MLYNLATQLGANAARQRLESLIKKGVAAELTEKKTKRSLPQNAYLHLLLGYFAAQTGNTLPYVKEHYYKRAACPDIFLTHVEDPILGNIETLRSSAQLTEDEMSLSISRFQQWAAAEAGIYLPEATHKEAIEEMQIEVERYRQYLY